MTRRSTPVLVALAAAAALGLSACGTQAADSGAQQGAAPESASVASPTASPASTDLQSASPSGTAAGDATATPGAYIGLADYEKDPAAHAESRVVYFFHASWCPSCRATDAALRERGVPDGLTVVQVDYDTATELRQRYGVTTQHTFVQVAPDGAQRGKWTGSADGAAILAQTR